MYKDEYVVKSFVWKGGWIFLIYGWIYVVCYLIWLDLMKIKFRIRV